MKKFLFEAYDALGRQVFTDASGAYWKEPLGIEVVGGKRFTMYRSVPHDDIEGGLGEPIQVEYEVFDESVVCDVCDSLFEDGCEYVGDFGYDYSFACGHCIETELNEDAERVGMQGFF